MKTIKSKDGILIDLVLGDMGAPPDRKGGLRLNTTAVWVKLSVGWVRSPFRSSTDTVNYIEKNYYTHILKEWIKVYEKNQLSTK